MTSAPELVLPSSVLREELRRIERPTASQREILVVLHRGKKYTQRNSKGKDVKETKRKKNRKSEKVSKSKKVKEKSR